MAQVKNMSAIVQTALAMMQSDILNNALEQAVQTVLGVICLADDQGKPITKPKNDEEQEALEQAYCGASLAIIGRAMCELTGHKGSVEAQRLVLEFVPIIKELNDQAESKEEFVFGMANPS